MVGSYTAIYIRALPKERNSTMTTVEQVINDVMAILKEGIDTLVQDVCEYDDVVSSATDKAIQDVLDILKGEK